MKTKKHVYLGILFVILQIFIIVRNYYDNFINFFWLCDITAIFIAIGFFTDNKQLVRGILNILLIPQMIYIIAFATKQLVLPHLSKIPSLIADLYHVGFITKPTWFIISALLLHLTGLIALKYTIKEPFNKKSLEYSVGILVIIYIIMVIFTKPEDNINFVFTLSKNVFVSIIWIPITYMIAVLPTYHLQKWMAKKF